MTVSAAMSKVPCLNQAMGGGRDVGLDEVGSKGSHLKKKRGLVMEIFRGGGVRPNP